MSEKTREIRRQIKFINHCFFDLITFEINGRNLTVPQVLVLRCIDDQPKMISYISERVLLSNSTVSGIVDRLEKSGYVKRVRDPEDRRVVWVAQTEKLIKLREEFCVLSSDYFEFLLEDLEAEKIDQIQNSLHLLAEHMQDKIKQYKSN